MTPRGALPPPAAIYPLKRILWVTVHAVVIGAIFALLVRHYALEPMQVPTQSMAPTLVGTHVAAHCPNCGLDQAVALPLELVDDHRGSKSSSAPGWIYRGPCPSCARIVEDQVPDPGEPIECSHCGLQPGLQQASQSQEGPQSMVCRLSPPRVVLPSVAPRT